MGSTISSMWTTLFGEVPVPLPPELDCTLPFPTKEDIVSKQDDWSSKEIQDQLPADILLLTANDHEFNACYWYMKQVRLSSYSDEQGNTSVYFGQFGDEDDQNGKTNVKVALMKCAQGPSNAQSAVTRAAGILNPKAVFFVGICATLKPEKAKLGDVVISAKLSTYDDRKVHADGKVEFRGVKNMIIPKNMADLIQYADHGWKPPLKDPNSLKVKVHRDVMLSGSELVNNVKRREELADHFQALGLEMEGAGLCKAAYHLGIEWAVIKAVSDLADGSKQKTEEWQPFASVMAASVVHRIFKDPLVLEGWRRHKETGHAKKVMTTTDGAHEEKCQARDISDKAKPSSISISADIVVLGDNTTVNKNHGAHEGKCQAVRIISGPTSKAPVSNCYEPDHSYWPRKKLDDEIQKIQKGKIKVLHGTIGVGKTSAARHYIDVNKQKFAISWRIDVSSGKDSIIERLTDLAKRLEVSYRQLFQTIQQKSENEGNIMFMLDNVQNKPSDEWFEELWNIRKSVYIIITTNSSHLHLGLPGVEGLRVEKFDEALEFLEEISAENSEQDLSELCKQFGWNILGLTAARDYMLTNKITARNYLKRLRDSETVRKDQGTSSGHPTLYHSIRACLEEVDPDKFPAIATTSLISDNMIPEFLLSNQLSGSNPSKNAACLDAIHVQLKSLVQITKENGIRFFSYHSFTRYVIKDMIDESVKADLLYRLVGIFVRYISKDNRFSKSHFLQRTVREHAEVFLREWEDKQKDDRTSIALARLSELIGFTYTQQQPPVRDTLDDHFERARDLLHKLCGITEEDLQPADGSVSEILEEMFDITNDDLAVAHQLFTKLTKKSSELSSSMIEELVFLRTVNEQDLAMFPEEVKENETVKEKIKSSEPLSPSDVEVFVNHGVAYSVDAYRELFLPELYLSVIYSFGRNYFYRHRATLKHPSVYYIDLLKRAYCISRAISEKMNRDEAVLHEFLVQANGLLYLLVNDDYICQDGKHKKKEHQVHARDLKNAIVLYQKLINEERRFFEMGMLKRTKEDTSSKLKCYLQILKCYEILLKIYEDRGRCIKDGVQACEDLLELLKPYGAQNADRTKEHLVQYSRYMNAIAEFYLSINDEEYYPRAIEIFTLSAEQAEKYDVTTMFYLEALVGLADVFSRKLPFFATNVSIRHLKQCSSKESLREMQRKKPHIKKRILEIQKQHVATILKHCALLRRKQERESLNEAITSHNFDDADAGTS